MEVLDAEASEVFADNVNFANITENQPFVFTFDGSNEIYGIQVAQDEAGNFQKYQFQYTTNEEGDLVPMLDTLQLLPSEDENLSVDLSDNALLEETSLKEALVHIDNDGAILPDQKFNLEMISEYEDHPNQEVLVEFEENLDNEDYIPSEMSETIDSKEGIVDKYFLNGPIKTENFEKVFRCKTEIEDPDSGEEDSQAEEADCYEEEEINEEVDNTTDSMVESLSGETPEVYLNAIDSAQYHQIFSNIQNDDEPEEEEEVASNVINIADDERQGMEDNSTEDEFDNFEVVENIPETERVGKVPQARNKPKTNILKKSSTKTKNLQADNPLVYIMNKENLFAPPVNISFINPRSLLKSSHALLQDQNDDYNHLTDKLAKRFSRNKEAIQARQFRHFINSTKIQEAPVRKERLPRKQLIKPLERTNEDIVVEEVMVTPNGFIEQNNVDERIKTLPVVEYVEITDSDEDSSRKKRKKKSKVIEIDLTQDNPKIIDGVTDETEFLEEENIIIVGVSPKRKRGRPPKRKRNKTKIDINEELQFFEKTEYICAECYKSFPTSSSLKTHVQYHSIEENMRRLFREDDVSKFFCDKCKKNFESFSDLQRHLCGNDSKCKTCSKYFSNTIFLEKHKRRHRKENLSKCTISNFVFKKRKRDRFKCDVCSKRFFTISAFDIHSAKHKYYFCACKRIFVSTFLLHQHLSESCVKRKKIVREKVWCEFCGNSFKSMKFLYRHRKWGDCGKINESTLR